MSTTPTPTLSTNPARALVEYAWRVCGEANDRWLANKGRKDFTEIGQELDGRRAELLRLSGAVLKAAHKAGVALADVRPQVVALEDAVMGVLLWELPHQHHPLDTAPHGVYIIAATNRLAPVAREVERLADLLDGCEGPSQQTTAAADGAPSADEEDLSILRVLAKRKGLLLTIGQIAGQTEKPRVGERTVADRIISLIAAGLANRPNGKKKGAAITPAGEAFLAKISPPPKVA